MITVFVNGCFDLFHIGHARLLEFCRRFGERLVIGINSDESVKRLKGEGRPIICESHRMQMLYALGASEVIIYDEPTPYEVVLGVHPDVLVVSVEHGDQCESSQHVRSYGGQVVIYEGRHESTTEIIERCKRVL